MDDDVNRLRMRNEQARARMHALFAIERAKLAHLPHPEEGVMQALKEAIDERAAAMVRLAFEGRVESAEYRVAENQLRRWNAAWR